ncbi:hypothetical protein [Laspinema sp. D2d]|nr:hypothetical protein [Laspinema sp. D2d]
MKGNTLLPTKNAIAVWVAGVLAEKTRQLAAVTILDKEGDRLPW